MNSINPTNQMTVSVIVTTKNEEKNIANCLKSIKNSINPISPINPNVEIIVVDNNSTDNTVKIAKRFTHNVYNKGPQRGAQLNFGVGKARGKYILYLDADMILSEKVITECVDKCENEDYIALYIPEKIIGNSFWIRVRGFERSFYNATCIDAVRFVRRDKFSGIGGFDENLIFGADDWHFDRRIKEVGDVSIIESPLYHNEGRFNLRKYLRRKGYYSKSLDGYVEKWGKDDPIIKKQLGAWYRLFGVFIENGKRKRLISHPLLTVGMYLLRFMVAVTYLKSKKKLAMMRYREDIETRLTGRHKMAMRLSGEIENRWILNIGCWNGWYERFVTENECKLVVGIDTDYKAITKAKDSVNKANFLLSSALELPFKDNCFDIVTMFDVIEHIPRNTEIHCLTEMSRVLKSNGTLILSTPNNHFLAKILDPAWYLGHRHCSQVGLEGLLTKSGFQIESVDYGGGFYELFSMILLYIFKWAFKREIPWKGYFENNREKEYSADRKGFVTLFVKARK